MNSTQIKCFLSVGKTLSFTASAQELFLSQSTISKNVKNLEKELNIQLIDRSHQTVKLTTKGKIFYNKMLKIDQEIKNLVAQLHTDNSGKVPTVFLGYMDIPFETDYLPVAIKLINQILNINLRMRVIDPNNPFKLSEYLKTNNLNFLIYQKDYFSNMPEISFSPLLTSTFSVLVNTDDPLYLKHKLSITDLNNRNLWVWNSNEKLPTVNKLVTQIKAKNINYTMHYISDGLTLSDYVLTNKGIGIVPGVLYDKNDPSLRYIPLDCDISIEYGLAYLKETKKEQYFKGIVRSFANAVEIMKKQW